MKYVWLSLGCLCCLQAQAEEFSFDFSEYQRPPWELNGYVQASVQQLDLNADSALNQLSPDSDFTRYLAETELSGVYRWDQVSLQGLAKWQGQTDRYQTQDQADIYELYVHYQPSPNWQWELGKRSLKWGKGYAFNPVAVFERTKDALDPELAREGFVMGRVDWVKDFSELGSLSFTTALLPVSDSFNQDFGENEELNVAAKLSWVVGRSDIDLIWRNQASQPAAYGLSLSHSLAVNFAIHAEFLWAKRTRWLLDENAQLVTEAVEGANALVGLRYLTNQETTWIAELYHQSAGYDVDEMHGLYHYAPQVNRAILQSQLENTQYLLAQAMQNYASIKVTQKEPWNWLYWSLGLGAIVNLDDASSIVTPEVIYTGLSNLEWRLRANIFNGANQTEYAERQYATRTELQMRWYF